MLRNRSAPDFFDRIWLRRTVNGGRSQSLVMVGCAAIALISFSSALAEMERPIVAAGVQGIERKNQDGTAGDDADPVLLQAKGEMHRESFSQAEQTLNAYLQRHPDSATGLYLLGEVLMRKDQAEESLRILTRAAAVRTPTGDELRLVGLDYVLLHDDADAIRWLRRSTDLSPDNPEAWYSLGRAQYSQGNFPAAETSFRKTLALDGTSAKAENNLGLALAAQNQPEKALAAYRRAVALQDHFSTKSEQPLLNLGLFLFEHGQLQEAADVLVRATDINPNCAQCQEAVGRALLPLNRITEAEVATEKAVALDPTNPRYHFLLGRLYKRIGETEKSRVELKRSAELYGTHSTPSIDETGRGKTSR